MSIIVYWELNMPTCDFCGTQLPAEYSAATARDAMKRASWGTQDVPEETVRTAEQKLVATAKKPGMVAVDLCALCVREGKRNENKPAPFFPPGGYLRYRRR